MLDLYFGLDASGFEKSSEPSPYICITIWAIYGFSRSRVPQLSGSNYDGHVRVPKQHIAPDWYVGTGLVLRTVTDTSAVLVSVSVKNRVQFCPQLPSSRLLPLDIIKHVCEDQ